MSIILSLKINIRNLMCRTRQIALEVTRSAGKRVMTRVTMIMGMITITDTAMGIAIMDMIMIKKVKSMRTNSRLA
jgi:hypothetical protein